MVQSLINRQSQPSPFVRLRRISAVLLTRTGPAHHATGTHVPVLSVCPQVAFISVAVAWARPYPCKIYPSNMVYIKSYFSHFPDFPSDTNAWSFLLNHPLGLPAPLQDHVMFIDGLTGLRRTRYEFIERVEIAAAALTTSRGCLRLEPADRVAILSENCLVIIGFIPYYSTKRISLTILFPRTI